MTASDLCRGLARNHMSRPSPGHCPAICSSRHRPHTTIAWPQAGVLPISPCPSYSSCRELTPMINTAQFILCCIDPASDGGSTLRLSSRPHMTHPCRLYSQYLHGSPRASVFSHQPPMTCHSAPITTPPQTPSAPLAEFPPAPPALETPSRFEAGRGQSLAARNVR
jgi:hypothetical protein